MKRIILVAITFYFLSASAFSQMTGGGGHTKVAAQAKPVENASNALSISASYYHLAAIEYERKILDNVGVSLGIVPVGAFITGRYHLNSPYLNSSSAFIKTGYSNVLLSYFKSFQLGAGFEYRAKRLLSLSADVGFHRYTWTDSEDIYYYDKASYSGFYFDICAGIYFPW